MRRRVIPGRPAGKGSGRPSAQAGPPRMPPEPVHLAGFDMIVGATTLMRPDLAIFPQDRTAGVDVRNDLKNVSDSGLFDKLLADAPGLGALTALTRERWGPRLRECFPEASSPLTTEVTAPHLEWPRTTRSAGAQMLGPYSREPSCMIRKHCRPCAGIDVADPLVEEDLHGTRESEQTGPWRRKLALPCGHGPPGHVPVAMGGASPENARCPPEACPGPHPGKRPPHPPRPGPGSRSAPDCHSHQGDKTSGHPSLPRSDDTVEGVRGKSFPPGGFGAAARSPGPRGGFGGQPRSPGRPGGVRGGSPDSLMPEHPAPVPRGSGPIP
jgi:hypothetical protein